MKTSGLYKIINTQNSKLYVGSSNNIAQRWRIHLYRLKKGNHHSRHLQAAWNKYGKDAFKFEIISEVDIADLIKEEQRLLDTIRPWDRVIGYNCSPSAESPRGTKRIPITEETRLKMSIAQTGRCITWGNKISSAKAGKPQAAPNANRRRLLATNVASSELLRFDSAHDAARYLGNAKAYSNIHSVCKGKKLTYKGWRFEYVCSF